ncbi:gamma-tubulin complex component 2 homolog isoform X1 [Anopheles albimanus]|uniref:gamma-tubulin complex component 2 homolog isoform X1 n=1 Tax=Anopheles albimanus TaxID=7167 RepID=UPI001641CF6D|nr:gamma-tubulin complex component 2 homolog isoform X1 [Anopheles albimanus]
MSETVARRVLGELVKTSGSYSVEQITTIFYNRDGKYSNKQLSDHLALLLKSVPNGNRYVELFLKSNLKDTYATLVLVLNRLAKDVKDTKKTPALPQQQKLQQKQAQPQQQLAGAGNTVEPLQKRVSVFESPPLSSTRIITEQVTPENVQEIKEKIVQATSGVGGSRLSSSNVSLGLTHQPPRQCFEFSHQKAPIASWNFNYDELYPLQSKNVAAIPMASQEPIVVKELVRCLVGLKGSLIMPQKPRLASDPLEFQLSPQLTDSCRDMVKEILPFAANFSCVQQFIEESSILEGGLVLQALRSVLKTLMTDYYLSIAQLDDSRFQRQGELTMQRLLQFLKPLFPTMEELAATVSEIRATNCRGGQVLTLLYDRITATSGTIEAQRVLERLIEAAAVPFMEMLQLWIHRGVINDPQKEFLIEHSAMELSENELVDYWEKQYTIRQEKVPCFLTKYADIILRTGKYLNVVRVCGSAELQPTISPISKPFGYRHADQSYIDAIEEAYNFASSSLLNLIMDKYDLMGRLLSVKRYFLLQQGDFITEFMDAVEEDLRKDVDSLHPIRIANLLDVTLGLSSAKHDQYHDELKTTLFPYGIVTQISKIMDNDNPFVDPLGDTSQLTGIECFAFSYKAQWPVSIVLNLLSISKYQMIFRQLFYLKYVERMLCRVWIDNNKTRQLFAPSTAKLYRSAFTLRQKMLIAIQSFESYMMIEVIEPNWHIFYHNMKQVKNIDDVLKYHQDFLDQCLKNCMLTTPELLKPIINLCNICIKFCDFLAESQRHFVDAELTCMLASGDDYSLSSESDYEQYASQEATTMEPTETFSGRVEQFRHDFTNQLMTLLRKINETATSSTSERFINLIHRINFNSYYSEANDK